MCIAYAGSRTADLVRSSLRAAPLQSTLRPTCSTRPWLRSSENPMRPSKCGAPLADLHVMLRKRNPRPVLITDCAALMRKDGRDHLRRIARADGASGDSRIYFAPRCPELACDIADSAAGGSRKIAVARYGGCYRSIREHLPYYGPLAYSRVRHRGEHGWRYPIPHARADGEVPPHQFASHMLMVRRDAAKAMRRIGELSRRHIRGQWSE